MSEKTFAETIKEETDAALAELAKFEANGPKAKVAGAKAKNFLRNLKATIGGAIQDIDIKNAERATKEEASKLTESKPAAPAQTVAAAPVSNGKAVAEKTKA